VEKDEAERLGARWDPRRQLCSGGYGPPAPIVVTARLFQPWNFE
jgi:hypothetical protein